MARWGSIVFGCHPAKPYALSEDALFEALSHADHGAEDVCSIGLAGVKNWKLLRPLALA